MSRKAQQMPRKDQSEHRFQEGMASFLLAFLGMLILVRIGMTIFFVPTGASVMPPAAGTERAVRLMATVSASLAPVASPTRWPRPTRTLEPTATLVPVRLAVEQGVYSRYQTYFAALSGRFPALVLLPYPRHAEMDDVLAMQTSDGVIHWGPRASDEVILLREEPYAVAAHVLLPRDGFTLPQLVALASGQDQSYTMVSGDGGVAARRILDLDDLDERMIQTDGWPLAKEYVATHKDTWALFPWEVVDFRVRTLPVEGHIPGPEVAQDYPLVRRLWLHKEISLPRALVDDLLGALHYQPAATVELVAVGDIMLGRLVKERMQQDSVRYPFEGEGIQPILSRAHIAFGNLECPVSDRGTRQDKGYEFRADPEAIDGLTYAGFDVLSLANNHTGDYADLALADTLRLLTDAQIVPIGAGHTITEAHEAKIIEANGLRVAFLAYNQIGPNWFAATESSPGSAFMEPERMTAGVQAALQKADVVVVSCHWGVEYAPHSTASQQKLARTLAGAGAVLIIGHHSHVVQGLCYHNDTLTAYGLGNFVFDMYPGEASEGVMLHCLLDASGVKTVELIPFSIVSSQPVLMSPEDGARVVEHVMRTTQAEKGLPQ